MIGSDEIAGDGPLLDDARRLVAPGWARRARWRYDPRAAAGSALGRLRLKEWDYYGVIDRDVYVAVVIAHAGVVGVAAVQWVDLATGRRVAERVAVTPLGAGVALAPSSEAADASRFAGRGARVEIVRDADGARRVRGTWQARGRRGRGRADDAGDAITVELELAPAAGVAVAAPLGRGFYYNHKVPALAARGSIRRGIARASLDGAFAVLDWGRGVWPYRTSWRWATASGRLADGRRVGLTLGDVAADAGAAREDAVIVDDVVSKLGPVDFELDRAAVRRGGAGARAPWRLRDRDGRVDLVLTPRLDNGQTVRAGVIASELHQLIGAFTGTIVTDAGERLALDRLPGWAEEHVARW